MTSSLVGSEMCIRDSAQTHSLQPAATTEHTHTHNDTPAPEAQNPEEPPCLLYTSDAADDM
eukprot:1999677-Prorocentrum_lima.AAC.1